MTFKKKNNLEECKPKPFILDLCPKSSPGYGSSGAPIYSESCITLGREAQRKRRYDQTPEHRWFNDNENVFVTFSWPEWILLDLSLDGPCRDDNMMGKCKHLLSLGHPLPNLGDLQVWHRGSMCSEKKTFTGHLLRLRNIFKNKETALNRTLLRWNNPMLWNHH